MSRSSLLVPDQSLLSSEQRTEAGAVVKLQTVEACVPRLLSEFSVTRPANTTAYAAGDALTDSTSAPTALTIAGVARVLGGGGLIRRAQLIVSVNDAGWPNLELFLFNGATAPTPDNDNSPFTPTDAELLKYIGRIVFHSNNFVAADALANSVCDGTQSNGADASRDLSLPFVCDPTLTNLWGLVVVRNAYTPSSATNYAFRLCVEPA